ncbi:MAG: hypothetical protein LKF96_11140 [Treponema sp.]|jgi:hypothetical protein|nr:hypothetical protein [Treponema sp.]
MCYSFFPRFWGFPFGHMFFGFGGIMGLFWIVCNVILASVAVGIAKEKGRNSLLWFFLTLLFGLPMLVAIYLLPLKRSASSYDGKPSDREF